VRPLARVDVERRDAGVVVARVEGEVDLSNASAVQTRLADAVPNHARGLVLVLDGLEHIDSAGVRMAFELATRLRERGQALRVALPPGAHVRRVLEITAFDAVAAIDATVDEAVEAIAAAGD
jgi:anti-sigma B factor antagonist